MAEWDVVVRPLQETYFCLRSRKAKNVTGGIYSIFREYHFDPDAEIGPKGVLCKGLVVMHSC